MDIALLAPLLQDTVARLEMQLPYASALVTRATGTTVRVTPKSTAVEPREPMLGAVLSAFTGQAFVEVSTNDLSRAGLEGATAALLERAQRAGVDPAGPRVDPGPPLVKRFEQAEQIPAAGVPLAEKVARAREIHGALHARTRELVHSVVRVGDVQSEELFINRTRHLYQRLARAEAVAFLVMARDGAQAEVHGGRGRAGGFEHCQLEGELLDELVRDGSRIIGAPRLDGGTYPVGHGLRRRRHGVSASGPAAPSQPHADHPGRQLPAPREAEGRNHRRVSQDLNMWAVPFYDSGAKWSLFPDG